MFQTINRLQRVLLGRLGKPFRRIKPSNHGQTAIILILVIAIALIIYAISLNWARVAQYKTMTTIGSNTAASNMASVITSYGEQQLQVNLGGRPKYCERTNFIVMIVVIIIVIIITIITWGAAVGLLGIVLAAIIATVAIALAVASLIINLVVIQPGLTRLWNRMQDKLMTMEDKVVENGIMTAMQTVVTDQVNVDDHFDMDTDGLWVNKNGIGNAGGYTDKISRFGYYYTWRLKQLQPMVIPEVEAFVQNLNELIYDNPYGRPATCTPAELAQIPLPIKCLPPDNFGLFDPRCSSTSKDPSPYCNPCCQPVTDPGTGRPLRPADCTPADLDKCTAGDYPVDPYTWQYDPYYEDDRNNKDPRTGTNDPPKFLSFREKLGVDDENEGFERLQSNLNEQPSQTRNQPNTPNIFKEQDTTGYYTNPPFSAPTDNRQGVFPFFWEMGNFERAVASTAPALPKTDDVTIVAVYSTDPNKILNRFKTLDDQCAIDNWVNDAIRPQGFWWKPGSDQYCSTTYPYNDCSSVISSGVCSAGTFTDAADLPSCGCAVSANKDQWHEDPLDNLVYGLKGLIGWGNYISRLEPDARSQTFADWFPSAAEWIAPMCKEEWNCEDSDNPDNANQIDCATCNDQPMDGMLLVWHKQLTDWVDLLDDWLYNNHYADPASWCLRSTDISSLPSVERNALQSARRTATIPLDRLGNPIWYLPTIPDNPPPTDAFGNPRPLADNDWGYLSDTIACLDFNADNPAKFASCDTACAEAAADPTACQTTCATAADVPACMAACLPTAATLAAADNCLDLPRSAITPKFDPSTIDSALYDSYGIDAFYVNAQQLQNCLNSPCANPQDATGNTTLLECSAVPILRDPNTNLQLVTAAVNCAAFQPGQVFYDAVKAARDTQFNQTSVCTGAAPTLFQNKVALSRTAADAQVADTVDSNNIPVSGFPTRLAYLTKLRDDAIKTRSIFFEGYKNFHEFLKPCNLPNPPDPYYDPNDPATGLGQGPSQGCVDPNNSCPDGGPAAQLICARREDFNSTRGLANFAIYGWQSGKIITGRLDNRDGGYWHIVRVEAFVPKRCYHQCITDKFPKVRTYTEWRFGGPFGFDQFRCYELVHTTGRVIARVTRYDEDQDTFLAKFANGQKIWDFRFNNPGGPALPVRPTDLGAACRYDQDHDQDHLYKVGTSDTTQGFLDGAFMINGLPADQFPDAKFKDPNTNNDCWVQVNKLLARGVQTTTCAEYFLDESIRHMSLRFVPCDDNAVNKAVQCAAGGTNSECQ